MILSKTGLTSKIVYIHFSTNKILTPTMSFSFSTQNILYLKSFPLTNLADASLHLTSCKPQMSTLLLHITSTTSFDQPLIVSTFHKHTLLIDNLVMLTSNTNHIVRGTFNLVVSSPHFTLNCIGNCHIIQYNKVLRLDALPKANL